MRRPDVQNSYRKNRENKILKESRKIAASDTGARRIQRNNRSGDSTGSLTTPTIVLIHENSEHRATPLWQRTIDFGGSFDAVSE